MSLDKLLLLLENNLFDPLFDSPSDLPDLPGIYLMTTRSIDCLPKKMRGLSYEYMSDNPVIYTGIAGRSTSKKKSIRERDYKSHFLGNARKSTLRKSLGVLFELKAMQYDGEIGSSKYKFIKSDENKLTEWMKGNLYLHFLAIENPASIEQYLISHFNPPLNIMGNINSINLDFRNELSQLRKFVQ